MSAKRMAPRQVEPVVHAGVKYTAPNDNGKQVIVEAWDVASGKKLWAQEIYRAPINPAMEEDVQWVFITTLQIKDGKLLVTNERNDQYLLDLKTRKVERLPAPKKSPEVRR